MGLDAVAHRCLTNAQLLFAYSHLVMDVGARNVLGDSGAVGLGWKCPERLGLEGMDVLMRRLEHYLTYVLDERGTAPALACLQEIVHRGTVQSDGHDEFAVQALRTAGRSSGKEDGEGMRSVSAVSAVSAVAHGEDIPARLLCQEMDGAAVEHTRDRRFELGFEKVWPDVVVAA